MPAEGLRNVRQASKTLTPAKGLRQRPLPTLLVIPAKRCQISRGAPEAISAQFGSEPWDESMALQQWRAKQAEAGRFPTDSSALEREGKRKSMEMVLAATSLLAGMWNVPIDVASIVSEKEAEINARATSASGILDETPPKVTTLETQSLRLDSVEDVSRSTARKSDESKLSNRLLAAIPPAAAIALAVCLINLLATASVVGVGGAVAYGPGGVLTLLKLKGAVALAAPINAMKWLRRVSSPLLSPPALLDAWHRFVWAAAVFVAVAKALSLSIAAKVIACGLALVNGAATPLMKLGVRI
eukprot:6208832-Pleurochrysis_carterae.AAC.2